MILQFGNWVRRLLKWIGSQEPLILVTLLLVVLGLWGIITLTSEVIEGDTQKLDERIVLALRNPEHLDQPIGPTWLREIARDITALGGVAILLLATLVVSGFLWISGKHRLLVFLLICTTSGVGWSVLLKAIFQRPRPDVVPHLAGTYTSSFPSGHSLMSAVVYLTLGVLLASAVPRKRVKAYVLSVAILLTFLVGATRVYLGVHYPTDVLAGWGIGLIWALTCWLVDRWLVRHRKVEGDQPVTMAQ